LGLRVQGSGLGVQGLQVTCLCPSLRYSSIPTPPPTTLRVAPLFIRGERLRGCRGDEGGVDAEDSRECFLHHHSLRLCGGHGVYGVGVREREREARGFEPCTRPYTRLCWGEVIKRRREAPGLQG